MFPLDSGLRRNDKVVVGGWRVLTGAFEQTKPIRPGRGPGKSEARSPKHETSSKSEWLKRTNKPNFFVFGLKTGVWRKNEPNSAPVVAQR